MARPRKRYTKGGRPTACRVNIPPALAEFLYRERMAGNYRDETDLVCAIVRKWTEGLDPVEWPAVLAAIKKEEAEEK
jgi:hypothetical protein